MNDMATGNIQISTAKPINLYTVSDKITLANTSKAFLQNDIVIGFVQFQVNSQIVSYEHLIRTDYNPNSNMRFPLYNVNMTVVAGNALYMDYYNKSLRATVTINTGIYSTSFYFIKV